MDSHRWEYHILYIYASITPVIALNFVPGRCTHVRGAGGGDSTGRVNVSPERFGAGLKGRFLPYHAKQLK